MKYYPDDENKTLLNTLIWTNLPEYLNKDIKVILNQSPMYSDFIQSKLSHLIFMNNMIFNNYQTTANLSAILTSNMTYVKLDE